MVDSGTLAAKAGGVPQGKKVDLGRAFCMAIRKANLLHAYGEAMVRISQPPCMGKISFPGQDAGKAAYWNATGMEQR